MRTAMRKAADSPDHSQVALSAVVAVTLALSFRAGEDIRFGDNAHRTGEQRLAGGIYLFRQQ